MNRFVFLILLVLTTNVALGQHLMLNDSVHSFGEQIVTLFERTNNSEAISIGQDFNALWPNSISTEQQSKVMQLAIAMQESKHPTIPFQRDFFGALTSGINQLGLSGTKLDNFLEMLSKSFEATSPRNFARELVNLRTLFERQTLHYSRNNSLYAYEADFDFEFVEAAAPKTYEEIVVDQITDDKKEEEIADDGGWGDDNGDSWDDTEDSWNNDPVEGWGDSDDSWENEGTGSLASAEDDGEVDAVVATFEQSATPDQLPEKKGAIIQFNRVDLVFVTRYDSTSLSGTKGFYLLDKYLFVGEGGRFDWSSAGMDPQAIYVDLESYSFNTRNPHLEAANAKLSYADKTDQVPKGYFEFKSLKRDSISDTGYPKFISYENNIRLKNIGDDNLNYVGGVAVEGRHLMGASIYGRPSSLDYTDEEGRKFKSRSKLFDFGDSIITSYNSKVAIYHGRDSITHPSVKARFYTNDKRFVVIKDNNGYRFRPFNASYFDMTIDADMINWDMTTDSMNIAIMNARSMVPAYFKSSEYYDFEEVKELTGVYNFNPLLVVYSYGAKHNTREFYVSNLIQDLNLNEKAVRGAMQHLLYLDFIEYEDVGGRIYLKDKAIHFVRSKNKRKDYDDLMIPSLSTAAPNATLHVESGELTVRGIDKFYISEILDVHIYPRNNEIRLLKNRDFVFDGQLFAGNFEFGGRNFTFRYDSFLVDMLNIDSVKFYVDKSGGGGKDQVDNKLVSVELAEGDMMPMSEDYETRGTLYINRPDNKSGTKIYPQYPFFDANRGAIVYFDSEQTLGGAYDKSVYFVIPPFAIDSLSSSDPATIGFDGTFVTGGILPEFKDKLQIMPDNSLGFDHTIPQDGYNLYGGSGKIYDKITLDKNGLVGSGKIDYLKSSSFSDNYVFYLDSMVAEGTNFKIDGGELDGVSFPQMYAYNFDMSWIPGEDHMYVRNRLDSFQLYNNSATLDGFIDVNKSGVNGGGTMATRGFTSESEDFTFTEHNLVAKNSMFEMASDNPDKPLLRGDDIRLEFDFNRDVAEMSPEIEGMAAINFPYAQFKTSISKAQWNLQEQKVYMSKPPEVDIENSYFYTTREDLDSLAFNAEAAEYDIRSSQLKVSGIPYIMVADALITPQNNEVLIFENATIGELYNTTIVMDTLNEFHKLVDGTIRIHSRTSFSGDATYQFVSALKDTYNIKMGKFELWQDPGRKNALPQTVSSGYIGEDKNLLISEGMFYKGDVTMYARNRALKLDGYIQFDLPSRENYDTWIKYSSQDDETQDVMFDMSQAITEDGQGLNAGVHYGSFDNDLYVTFAEEKKNIGDEDFFSPAGIVHFNAEKGMFMIEDTAKANGSKYSGKVFGYSDATGSYEFEGPLRFVESTDDARLTASGFGKGNINDGTCSVNSLLKFDYSLPDQALMLMAADMFEVIENFGAPEAENDPDAFLYKASEIIGERATVEYDQRNQEEYLPIASFTSKMIGSLVFSKVELEWSPTYKSWYSTGKVGLSNILRADMNASIDGFIEIRTSQELGTTMNIFMQVSSDCWYYFGFENNRLMIYSSNDDFIDVIASKSNISKAGFGEYVFVDADLPDVLKYVDRFREQYLGIKEPYEIRKPVDEYTDNVDILEVPVDNTEDGDVLPMEIEDNTETLIDIPEDNAPDLQDPLPDDQVQPEEQQPNEDEVQSEEDLLQPVVPDEQEEQPAEEEDDEGF